MDNNSGNNGGNGGGSNSMVIVVLGLGFLGIGAAMIYILSKNSAANAGLTANPFFGTSSTGTNPAIAALQSQVGGLSSSLEKLLNSKSSPPKPSGGSGSGGAPGSTNKDGSTARPVVDQYGNALGTTVDKAGNYIEKGDPTTLYDKTGNVKADLDPSTGMFVDKSGNVIAANDGTPVSSFDPTSGNYIEAGDKSTLYNEQGNAIGDLDSSTGMYVNSSGQVVGTSDGAAVANYDSTTGAYQEADGTWYGQDGTEYQSYNPTNGTYVEAGDPTTLYNNDGSIANDNYNSGAGDVASSGSDTSGGGYAGDPYADAGNGYDGGGEIFDLGG